tara:strand:+ start:768 stop:1724 length:957 start_codon:yes stop_codon:yes gene_type:complete
MKKDKLAFIIGVTGQDGCYLSLYLLKKNYKILGFTRSKLKKNLKNLKKTNLIGKIKLKKYSENNPNTILRELKKNPPDEVYYFAGQSSVGLSYKLPLETYSSNICVLFYILEFLRSNNLKTKLYNSCSTDCFGYSKNILKKENDEFNPISPYGRSKSFAFWLTKFYRENYNLHSKNGILSNHESPLRNSNFVFKKVVNFLKNRKKNENLYLGNISVFRDWGWAPDFSSAIHKINVSSKKKDYVVGTGKLTSLKKSIYKMFLLSGVDKKFLKINNKKFSRPTEIKKICANPALIKKELSWSAKIKGENLLDKLLKEKII